MKRYRASIKIWPLASSIVALAHSFLISIQFFPCLFASSSSAQARMRHSPGVWMRPRSLISILAVTVLDPTPVAHPILRKTSNPIPSVGEMKTISIFGKTVKRI
ncbi:hypothetical protein BDV95DRAFT_74614 [Massariosphaeria phaeospora]|uniref:Uncharacterized protein n=1 Tax=Massariosphaeria phaeospora TaxID=100035 RepID=A0A7C8I7F9_9PLEO|nr:hypothetical protein BDV95DRAFT_74614 [Massariosphaeria phaeospora]